METKSPHNMSTNSWSSLPKAERIKTILKLQETNNQMKLDIDNDQKTLAELRQTIPDECLGLFEKEKKNLLNHYLTAELLPHLSEQGLNADEIQRMGNTITARANAQVADREETKNIIQETEEKRHKNEFLNQQVDDLAANILRRLEN
ncbi:hypothetical protein L3Y34_001456 [Caenorhabditis briggsae]|uniref:Uncharacterized protein n=2 Tax=Caenorhabditis briggsae TaxID=6238 RepID=A0AAE9DCL8_CAEBR|nr:hypothetical protein L3Y34_001456 [Caenorhabditis briggsae]